MPKTTYQEKADKQNDLVAQELTTEKMEHKKFIVSRMHSAVSQRYYNWEEFDNMTLPGSWEFNKKMATSFNPPRKNASDVRVVTGTARAKMKSIAAAVQRLNLDSSVYGFDKNNDEDRELGMVMTQMLRKSKEIDDDEEKKLLRVYELLEQGTCFTGEVWEPTRKVKKTIKNPEKLDPSTGFAGLKYETEYEWEYKATRKLYSTLDVYLGNMREYEMDRQPFIFKTRVMSYDEAATIFGDWEEWKNVTPGKSNNLYEDGSKSIPYNNFSIGELESNQVEIIWYEDLPNNEYQIFINGVMMLPVGFPMYWEWDGYSVVKNILDPISKDFAYGRSFMSDIRFNVEVLDEFLRIFIQKTKLSAKPPLANNTGSALGSKVFDPGQVISGVDPDKIKQIMQTNGVTAPEFNMYELLKGAIDADSVSPTFQGQQATGSVTATETLAMQKQAQQAMSLTLFAVSLMEEKSDYMRLMDILANWTTPVGVKVDKARDVLVNKYRQVHIDDVSVNGKKGAMKVEIVDKAPSQEERMQYSYQAMKDARAAIPVKRARIILETLKNMKYNFFIKNNPTERISDNFNKILFKEKADQLFGYFPNTVNVDNLQKSWAQTWEEDVNEAFTTTQMPDMNQLALAGGASAMEASAPPVPTSDKPQPKRNQGSDLGNSIRGNVGGAGNNNLSKE